MAMNAISRSSIACLVLVASVAPGTLASDAGAVYVEEAEIAQLDADDDARLRGYFGGGSVDSILSGRDFAVRRSEPTP